MVSDVRALELAKLALDVAAQLLAVLLLERAELVDLGLEGRLVVGEARGRLLQRRLLGLESGQLRGLRLLRLGLLRLSGGLGLGELRIRGLLSFGELGLRGPLSFGELDLLRGLRLGHDASCGRVPLGDQRVALLHALAHVLLVQTTRELQEVVGVARVERVGDRRRRRRGGRDRLRHGGRGGDDARRDGRGSGSRSGRAALKFADARVAGDEALTQLLVLLVQSAQLDDDLVEEVIDLVLVVALAELRRIEPLVDHVFRSQSHVSHLVVFHRVFRGAPPGDGARRRGSHAGCACKNSGSP